MNSTSAFVVTLLLTFPALPAMPALAQDAWPTRTVRIVVPSSPGGGTDTYARLLGQGLAEALKQHFIVDNRPGASGNVGTEIAARAPADGYTFLVAASPALVINPFLYKKLPFNAERDFTPVTRGVTSPIIFTSHPSVPVKTFGALVALGRREAGKLAYGSSGPSGPGSLIVKMVEEASGARFLHVPYKGIGQAVQGLLRGDTAFMVSDIGSVLPHIRSGRAQPLAVTTKAPQLPAIPTLAASGYPKIEANVSFMVFAPAGTPAVIVQRFSTAIASIMKSSALREKLDGQALTPVFDTPDEFAASLRQERAMWAGVIRRNNITAD
jgi:tripartite-type tricarboxylate transporter receptor subunit TctC